MRFPQGYARPDSVVPPVATMRGASIVVIAMSRASVIIALPMRARDPVRRFQKPATAALLPVPGDMTVARPHPRPGSRFPDVAMAVRGPVAGRPDMTRNGDRDVLDHGRRRTDVDTDRNIPDPEANVRAVGEGWRRKQRDQHDADGRNMLDGSHIILLVNRAPRTGDTPMNKLTQQRAGRHPQNCKAGRPFVSGCGSPSKVGAVPVGMNVAFPDGGRDGDLGWCLCYDCLGRSEA